MNPWQKLVVKHKVAKNTVPEGWLTREQVAAQLACSEDKVNTVLKNALKAGDVESQNFPVWDKIKKKVLAVPCYRIVEGGAPQRKKEGQIPSKRGRPPMPSSWPYPKGARVRRRDGGEGVMLDKGRVRWSNGAITTPSGSTIRKIIPL